MAKTITLDHDFFEHLLNCLCNQKFLPMPGPSCLNSEDEQINQKFIDEAYHKARRLWIENGKEKGNMDKQELTEQLADKEHASWSRWMNYLFSKCKQVPFEGTNNANLFAQRDLIIPAELVERWQRQIDTPYAELSEREKQSDRDEVAHILPIIEQYVSVEH